MTYSASFYMTFECSTVTKIAILNSAEPTGIANVAPVAEYVVTDRLTYSESQIYKPSTVTLCRRLITYSSEKKWNVSQIHSVMNAWSRSAVMALVKTTFGSTFTIQNLIKEKKYRAHCALNIPGFAISLLLSLR
jgi:hypothetical protein